MRLVARDATREDYAAFARLYPELRVPDPTPSLEHFDARIRPHAFLLWEGGCPIGYAFWQRLGDAGRVGHVVVDRAARGKGVGAALMGELAVRAKRAGCSRWELHVKPDNRPAIRLYEAFGLRAVARPVAMRIAWSHVARLLLEEGATAFVVAPLDESRIETATGLLSGQIGGLRRDGSHVFPALQRGGSIVGFAAFDPSVPHARPFVAARPGLARALLEAMRPHALAAHPFVRFVTEDGAIVGAARRAGAEIVLDMIRMEGSLGT